MIKYISDVGRYPLSTTFLPVPIMIMGQRESKPTDLNILQCQKAITEVPSVLPTVKKKK